MILKIASAEQQALIRKVCNEDVNTRDRDLQTIKEWLKKQPHLPDSFDDEILMNFLRDSKFSIEKTKRKLDKYFTVKTLFPDFFSNRDIRSKELQDVFNHVQIVTIPEITPEGRRICAARIIPCDQDNFNIISFLKILLLYVDVALKTDKIGVTGDVFLLDVAELSFKHVVKMTPTVAKKFFMCLQEAYPYRLKELHFVRVTPILDYVLKIISPFLKEKIRKRIHRHKDVDSLHDYLQKEFLPEEFGGLAGKMSNERWEEVCVYFSSWVKKQEEYKTDESKRTKECMRHQDLFGMDGSFKQLTID